MTDNIDQPTVVVSPIFQFSLIAITSLVLTVSFHHAFTTFSSSDIAPSIKTVSPEKLVEFGSPAIIKAGLYIDQFQKFDIVKNEFIFTGSVWFMFAPGVISINTLEQFSFARGQILYRSPPDTKLINEELLLVRYDVRVNFNSGIDFSYFPVDDHELYIMLTHQFVSPNELLFESAEQEFVIIPSVRNYGWKQINKSVAPGYTSAELDEGDPQTTHMHPAVLFSIEYVRTGLRYIVTILLPLLLIFYLSLFSFSLDPKTSISLSAGSVTAILAYRFVIENMSPPVGYFMISDYLFLLFLASTVFVFFIVTVNAFAKPMSLIQKKITLCLLHLAVSLITTYIFFSV